MKTLAEKAAVRRQIKTGQVPANTESLMDYINQNGVRPGPVKLAQFRAALSLRGTPPLYSQEGKGDAAIVHVKLFDPCGSATWYLLEWNGQEKAFGYVTGLGFDEYGYVPLRELALVTGRFGIGIEIDTGFRPRALGEAKADL